MGEGAWIVDAASVAASVSRVPWRNLRERVPKNSRVCLRRMETVWVSSCQLRKAGTREGTRTLRGRERERGIYIYTYLATNH